MIHIQLTLDFGFRTCYPESCSSGTTAAASTTTARTAAATASVTPPAAFAISFGFLGLELASPFAYIFHEVLFVIVFVVQYHFDSK